MKMLTANIVYIVAESVGVSVVGAEFTYQRLNRQSDLTAENA